jgi:RNA polymerase sigma-70 factor (ECF subfamily)
MPVAEWGNSSSVAVMPNPGLAACSGAAAETRSLRADDDRLIREAQQGDAAAFEELVRQYDRSVLRLAIHLTGSPEDGQDIYQEAFLRAYTNLKSFRFECSFYTWIYRIVTNLCLDHLRKRRSSLRALTTAISQDGEEEKLVEKLPDTSVSASPERSLVGRELRDRIGRALRTLTPRERMVFELKHYHGLRLRTVAGMLNTTEGTIKNTLFRATHKLRFELAEAR